MNKRTNSVDFFLTQVWIEKRYVGSKHTSEWFNTAGRSVKTGLIASVIVSQVRIIHQDNRKKNNRSMITLFMEKIAKNFPFYVNVIVDLGCDDLAKLERCLAVWDQRTLLVCQWSDHSGLLSLSIYLSLSSISLSLPQCIVLWFRCFCSE